jgi:hypothetical protein
LRLLLPEHAAVNVVINSGLPAWREQPERHMTAAETPLPPILRIASTAHRSYIAPETH